MSTKQVDDAFTMGMKDAEAVIKNGTHSSLDNVIHYHALKKSGNPSIMKHTYGSFTEAKQNGEFEDYNIHEDPYMRKYTVMAKWMILKKIIYQVISYETSKFSMNI